MNPDLLCTCYVIPNLFALTLSLSLTASEVTSHCDSVSYMFSIHLHLYPCMFSVPLLITWYWVLSNFLAVAASGHSASLVTVICISLSFLCMGYYEAEGNCSTKVLFYSRPEKALAPSTIPNTKVGIWEQRRVVGMFKENLKITSFLTRKISGSC